MTGPGRGDAADRAADRPGPDGHDGTAPACAFDALRAPEIGVDAMAPPSWGDASSEGPPSTGSRRSPVEPWTPPSEVSPRDSLSPVPTPPSEVSPRDSLSAVPTAAAEVSPRDSLPAPRVDDEAERRTRNDAWPALPPLAISDDPASHAALQRWMDDDRAAHDDPPRPYRLLPPAAPALPPAPRVPVEDTAGDDHDEPDDGAHEDPSVRALREERAFEAQFGPWRAGAGVRTPMRRSTLLSPSVLLLAFVLLVVLYYAYVA